MVEQPNSSTPFGLPANVAAGLAYLLSVIGGIIMLVGGGTDRFVRWSAAQSITIFGVFLILTIAVGTIFNIVGMSSLGGMLLTILRLLQFAIYLWTVITAFQGKEVRVPVIADVTQAIFKSAIEA